MANTQAVQNLLLCFKLPAAVRQRPGLLHSDLRQCSLHTCKAGRTHAELPRPKPRQQNRPLRAARHFPAHRNRLVPFPKGCENLFQQPQHSRGIAPIVSCRLPVGPIGGTDILCQVIGAHAGEIHLLRCQISRQRHRRNFHHDPQPNMRIVGKSSFLQPGHGLPHV